ncbi:MAG TPA: hypothetical protein VL358_14425 [Caulobacteraceae bacterium]|jgi:hypothetical protein|nr:hypothetical protein [Caulobacteraceae bacterium]
MTTPEKTGTIPADAKPKGRPFPDDKTRIDPLATDDDDEAESHQEELLDEGIEESFPASDPVSVKRIT